MDVGVVAVLRRAFRLWWDEWVVFLALNAAWFFLQLPVVTGPPATAALFAMVNESYGKVYWGPRDAWAAFRRLFWPAWRWGLPNLLVIAVAVFNFVAYGDTPGLNWRLLRLLWVVTLFALFGLNLLYWPFWLAQDDKRLRTTYANAARFFLLNPLPGLALAAFSLLLTLGSLILTLPFTLALACWLACIATVAVQHSLEQRHSHR
ncbi:MAG: hypothetical protein RRC07_14725 [Anaerolineae bacterium]|nr:hypothetical protein [Anaerolineae bacterium]